MPKKKETKRNKRKEKKNFFEPLCACNFYDFFNRFCFLFETKLCFFGQLYLCVMFYGFNILCNIIIFHLMGISFNFSVLFIVWNRNFNKNLIPLF